VALADRGLQYGDGLFETIAVIDGQPALWQLHMQRLVLGSERLMLPPPDQQRLRQEAARLMRGQERAVLKIIYTAGASTRGYGRSESIIPSRMIWLTAAPEHPLRHWREGIEVGYCALRLMPQGVLAGVKHLGRLEQVLARREVDGRGLTEGLMLDQAGHVVEGVSSNLFAVFGDTLVTPPLTECGIRGVMRQHVLDLAASLNIRAEERPLDPVLLDSADELFVTNSVIGLWPVRSVEGRRYALGPITERLLKLLATAGVCLVPTDFNNYA
jgi:4-amino-4-deoxychorismate lyase